MDQLVGLLGPLEGLASFVPRVDEAADGDDQLLDAGEAAPTDGLLGDDPEEDLDHVEPARAGGREVKVDPGVALQPRPHHRVGVGPVVVQHDVQVSTGIGPGHPLEEPEELLVAVPVEDLLGDPAGGHLQGGEQGGRAVADVVVGGTLGQPGELDVPSQTTLVVWDVPDPYGRSLDDYRQCAEDLRVRIEGLGP